MMDNVNALFNMDIKFIDVVMPIGISFYTFQALSYVVDVYRREVKAQKDIYKLALYITLFPQLIAGPIVKYHDVDNQIDNRDVTFDKVAYGVKRFIIGLAKKMLLANTM
jgi:alginate O-acetyltransferase complex protein AlgI